MTNPTTEQLEAVYCLNKALNTLVETLPSFLNADRAADLVGNAIYALELPLNEDEDDAYSRFWELCEERDII